MDWKKFKKFVDMNFSKDVQRNLDIEKVIELYKLYLNICKGI